MLEKYGLQSSVASGSYNIAREPLYFVRSGTVPLNNGALRGYGESGWGWSRSAVAYGSATSANAYPLYFNPSVVNPSNGPDLRYYGFPVRCLVILITHQLS